MDTLQQDIDTLATFIVDHPRLVVLTGAGISAPSGIPTYRDRQGSWQHRAPIQEQDFLVDEQTRRRYWSRSRYGWPLIRDAKPNPAHRALAELESQGRIELLITQNVDGLHQRAGSRNVLDLHGAVDRVRCLTCGAVHCRESIQEQLDRDNSWPAHTGHSPRPDGDMEIPDALLDEFVLPQCPLCGGDLKPDVVFFGGTVSRASVATCHDALGRADALLAIGTSLMVFSGFRFCRRARELGKPVVLVNPGITRADGLAQIKLPSLAGPLLAGTIDHLKPGIIPRPFAPCSPS
ncbi:MAG: NAD-dependent protein deacetylase [Halioglobus sp.]|nr:NAD-dependent protein deacetylase [Halioglobus sp.]